MKHVGLLKVLGLVQVVPNNGVHNCSSSIIDQHQEKDPPKHASLQHVQRLALVVFANGVIEHSALDGPTSRERSTKTRCESSIGKSSISGGKDLDKL